MSATVRPGAFASTRPKALPLGVRIVVDVRPMQEPERSPLTCWYLEQLLGAFAAEPLPDESFVLVSRTLRDDPAMALVAAGLPVAGSRRLPPTTRALRAAGLTLDAFLLRGAELGAAAQGGAAVFHTAGGAVPIASQLPVVATLLDLAPWELPETYATSAASRFGHRLRARVLRDAARVIVCSRAVGESARRHLHLPAERLVVVHLAVDHDLLAAARSVESLAEERARLELPPRYLAFVGRFDARKDLRTLLRAVALLRARGASPATTASNGNGRRARVPMLVLGLEKAGEEDLARARRLIDGHGARESVAVVTVIDSAAKAAIITGAEAAIVPALSDATGLGALEALALGSPVICSRTGALPETVGSAGIVVEPRDASRMAAALEAMWADGSLAQQLRRQARRRSEAPQRMWSDVAEETRHVYEAAAGIARGTGPGLDDEQPSGRLRSIIDRFALR